MPRRELNQPVTLKDASLQNIACHFESYWCTGKTKNLNHRRLQKCIEPFEYFSDDMIRKILEILNEKNLLRRHHFQFLLSSNIRRLSLNQIGGFTGHNSVIQAVGVRCRKLTHLNLSELRTNRDVLCSIFTNLPELVSLNLSNTNTDHTVLKAVAKSCHKLLELNIDLCWTDRCPDYDIQEFANISEKLGVPKLKKLDCKMTDISVDTVVALLQSQRSLETLECTGDIHEAFGLMYGKEFQQTKEVLPEWIVPLLNLNIERAYERSLCALSENTHLELTLRCCPSVTDLQLIDLTDPTSVSHASMLRHLKVFQVRGTGDQPISFPKHLLPIFMKLGNNFTTLSLIFVSEISVMTIGELCPNLESLQIYLMDNVSVQYHVRGNPVVCFKHLTKITLIAFGNCVSEELLSTILVNANQLREIWFRECNLTDDIISKAVQKHGFKHLYEAHFDHCNLISSNTGMMLLSTDSPLRILRFFMCDNISDNDEYQLSEEVSRLGYNVRII